jgi:capsular polysaccharide biosynthesis protein
MRPEPGAGAALARLARFWWVVALCVIFAVGLALLLPVHRLSGAKATARIHEQDTTLAFSYKGDPQPQSANQTANDLTTADFVDPQIAQTAAKQLGGGITGSQLVSGLGFTALTGTDVQLTYSGGPPQIAQARLAAYVTSLIAARRSSQEKVLRGEATDLRAQGAAPEVVNRLTVAADSVKNQIRPVGGVTVAPARTISRAILLAGGLLAGLILGVLVALALGRADTRIRSSDQLRRAGVRSIEVDSGRNPASVDALRVLAEVNGVGTSGGVVAILAPSGGVSSLASVLAARFAAAGRPTTLLSPSGAVRSSSENWEPVEQDAGPLRSVPQAEQLLESGRPGEVFVLEGPGLMEQPEALVSAAVATITILALRPGRARWRDLEQSLELLEDAVVAGRVRVCLDSGSADQRGALTADAPGVRAERSLRSSATT